VQAKVQHQNKWWKIGRLWQWPETGVRSVACWSSEWLMS